MQTSPKVRCSNFVQVHKADCGFIRLEQKMIDERYIYISELGSKIRKLAHHDYASKK